MSYASRDMARAAKIPHTSAVRLVLASLFVIAFPALGQAQWTIAPTVSFGYGWSSGPYDYVGDTTLMREPCVPIPPTGGYNPSPGRTCPDERSPMVPYGGLGISVSHPLASRFALAFSFDATVGSTHRIGQRSATTDVYVRQRPSNPTPGVPDGTGWWFSPTYEIAYRGAATLRIHLGALRVGYVGTGLRAGQRIQLGPPGGESTNPDLIVREAPARGATLEALLEGGVILGDRRPVNVGVIFGAGRPLLRAELIVALPFTVGAR